MNAKMIEERLDEILEELGVEDLMDYTLDACGGNDLSKFYQEIIEEVLGITANVSGVEISDGKYRIIVFIDTEEYSIYSKARYGSEEIKEAIMSGLVLSYIDRRKFLNE